MRLTTRGRVVAVAAVLGAAAWFGATHPAMPATFAAVLFWLAACTAGAWVFVTLAASSPTMPAERSAWDDRDMRRIGLDDTLRRDVLAALDTNNPHH